MKIPLTEVNWFSLIAGHIQIWKKLPARIFRFTCFSFFPSMILPKRGYFLYFSQSIWGINAISTPIGSHLQRAWLWPYWAQTLGCYFIHQKSFTNLKGFISRLFFVFLDHSLFTFHFKGLFHFLHFYFSPNWAHLSNSVPLRSFLFEFILFSFPNFILFFSKALTFPSSLEWTSRPVFSFRFKPLNFHNFLVF